MRKSLHSSLSLSFIALAGAALWPGAPARAGEAADTMPVALSATTSLVTDYRFRGLSQTDENPAIQGSIDAVHDSGLYAGVWASNVDFNDGDEANTEFDWYGGYSHTIVGDLTGDARVIYYAYPGANDALDYDFYELYGALGYTFKGVTFTGSVNYSPEYFGKSGDAEYYMLAVEAPLPEGFSFTGHFGRQEVDDNAAFGLPDYNDWALGVGYSYQGFDLALQYIDTDIGSGTCPSGCGETAVFSVSRTF